MTDINLDLECKTTDVKRHQSRNIMLLTLLSIILVSLALGACVYLLIGKMPSVEDIGVSLMQSENSNGVDIDTSKYPIDIKIRLAVSGTIVSNSLISFTLNNLTVNVFHALSASNNPQLGQGHLQDQLVIVARDRTPFSIPVTLRLVGAVDNPSINSILNSCGVLNGGLKSPIVIQHQVFADVFIFSNMSVSDGILAFDCPDLSGLKIDLPLLGPIDPIKAINDVQDVIKTVTPPVKEVIDKVPEVIDVVADAGGSGVKDTVSNIPAVVDKGVDVVTDAGEKGVSDILNTGTIPSTDLNNAGNQVGNVISNIFKK